MKRVPYHAITSYSLGGQQMRIEIKKSNTEVGPGSSNTSHIHHASPTALSPAMTDEKMKLYFT